MAKKKSFWAMFGEVLSRRDGKKCHYCGREVLSSDEIPNFSVLAYTKGMYPKNLATVDHVIPLSKGGANDLENMVVCCRECNTKKGRW